ncbi:MAG: DNA repair protein RadA [Candidatus Margulisiibacteriota bacterium]|jgi:DNA repair protein RadA/Sms
MKKENQFICKSCEQIFPRWYGKCPNCEAWNSLAEEMVFKQSQFHHVKRQRKDPVPLSAITNFDEEIVPTGILEVDRVLGKGLVVGEVLLLGGEPGIGKSTLALQIAKNLAKDSKVLYISAEESIKQLALRAKRLGINSDQLLVYNEYNILEIIKVIKKENPKLVIIDSIQVVYHPDIPSMSGSINQVRHSASEIINVVKELNLIGILIGHITKDGSLAGPKVLEHLVDAILYFEGERNQKYRILRCFKNRFASTEEIGIFEIGEQGLLEVKQPSELFIDEHTLLSPGSMVVAVMEGSRVFLVEIQALVVDSGYGMAKRTFAGVDLNRSNLMIATLEKKFGVKLFSKDIFLNIIGGIRINETGLDLGIILAIISSLYEKPLGKRIAAIGEVGLTGEVRPVQNIEKRLNELAKMGFEECFIPEQNKIKNLSIKIKPILVNNIKEAIDLFLKG